MMSNALREVLETLIDATEKFTTEAKYKVEVGYEEELIDALDDARRLLASGDEEPAA